MIVRTIAILLLSIVTISAVAASPTDSLADNFVNCRYDHSFLNTGIGGGVIATGKYSMRSEVNYASLLWIHIID